jgi:hypothetical protein
MLGETSRRVIVTENLLNPSLKAVYSRGWSLFAEVRHNLFISIRTISLLEIDGHSLAA